MTNAQDEALTTISLLDGVNVRLGEVARTRAPVEVILSVRGRVELVPGKHGRRWRLRTRQGHIVTFRPEFVVAFKEAGQAHGGMPAPRSVSVRLR